MRDFLGDFVAFSVNLGDFMAKLESDFGALVDFEMADDFALKPKKQSWVNFALKLRKQNLVNFGLRK